MAQNHTITQLYDRLLQITLHSEIKVQILVKPKPKQTKLLSQMGSCKILHRWQFKVSNNYKRDEIER